MSAMGRKRTLETGSFDHILMNVCRAAVPELNEIDGPDRELIEVAPAPLLVRCDADYARFLTGAQFRWCVSLHLNKVIISEHRALVAEPSGVRNGSDSRHSRASQSRAGCEHCKRHLTKVRKGGKRTFACPPIDGASADHCIGIIERAAGCISVERGLS